MAIVAAWNELTDFYDLPFSLAESSSEDEKMFQFLARRAKKGGGIGRTGEVSRAESEPPRGRQADIQ